MDTVSTTLDVVLSPLLLHKSGTIIHLLLSESHHHLTPSNVTSKLTTLLPVTPCDSATPSILIFLTSVDYQFFFTLHCNVNVCGLLESVATLFRTNTLATTLMDQYMRMTSTKFVHTAVQCTVNKIMESKQSCEVRVDQLHLIMHRTD